MHSHFILQHERIPTFLGLLTPLSEQVVELLNESQEHAQNMASAWDVSFTQLMNGGIFSQMLLLGRMAAAIAIAVSILKFSQQLHNGQTIIAYQRIIMVIIAVMLLNNNGALLKNYVSGMRNSTTTVTLNIQQALSNDIDAVKAIQALAMDAAVSQVEKEQIRTCLLEENNQRQETCLEEAIETAQAAADAIRSQTGFRAYAMEQLQGTSHTILLLAKKGTKLPYIAAKYAAATVASLGAQSIFLWILGGLQEAFSWAMETGILLSSVVAPVAIGLSIFNAQALYSWFSGFFAFAVAKIAFNIIVSVVAILHVNAEEPALIAYSVFLGIIAPIISLMAAGMSGFGIFRLFGSYGPIVGTAATYSSVRMLIHSVESMTRRMKPGRR